MAIHKTPPAAPKKGKRIIPYLSGFFRDLSMGFALIFAESGGRFIKIEASARNFCHLAMPLTLRCFMSIFEGPN
jgi:hypothetical protein